MTVKVGIAILRVLAGLLSGVVAAGVLFVVAGLAGGASAGPSLGLIALGLGLALFPAVFIAGTGTPRHVFRRGLVALALEGLALLGVTYLRATNSTTLPESSLAWIRTLESMSNRIANWPVEMIGLGGVVALVLAIVLLFALRQPKARPIAATAAPAPASASPPASAPSQPSASPRPPLKLPSAVTKGSALKPASPGTRALDDEDTQLVADLENLRKKLPK